MININSYFKQILFFIIVSASLSLNIFAQQKQLTFNQVYLFGEPRLLKPLPQLKGWYDDQHYLKSKSENGKSLLVKVNAAPEVEEILLDYSKYDEILIDYDLTLDVSIANSNDYDRFLFSKDNDYYYLSRSSNKVVRLTNDNVEKKNPTLSPDGKKSCIYKKTAICTMLTVKPEKKFA